MNYAVISTLILGLAAVATSAWAIWCVWKSPLAHYKVLWTICCLLGFIGFKANWTTPDDLFLSIGIKIPPISAAAYPGTGQIIVEAMFPIIAVVALIKFGGYRADLENR